MPYTAPPLNAAARAVEFATMYPAEMEWLGANMETDSFAGSLARDVDRWGKLTDGQLAAVRRNLSKPEPVAVNVAAIEARFDIARGNLVKRPAMRLDTFVFKAAGDKSANAGGIYVTDAEATDEDGKAVYLGKVLGGKFMRVRACTDDQQARILAAASDPAAAAKAYGQRTGNCSICGRELTAEESIERFIGPICISKWGL